MVSGRLRATRIFMAHILRHRWGRYPEAPSLIRTGTPTTWMLCNVRSPFSRGTSLDQTFLLAVSLQDWLGGTTKMFSEKTKQKSHDWAKRLECPVDDERNYENTYVCVTDSDCEFRLIDNSGAIEIWSQFPSTGGHGRGKVLPDIGSLMVQITEQTCCQSWPEL